MRAKFYRDLSHYFVSSLPSMLGCPGIGVFIALRYPYNNSTNFSAYFIHDSGQSGDWRDKSGDSVVEGCLHFHHFFPSIALWNIIVSLI